MKHEDKIIKLNEEIEKRNTYLNDNDGFFVSLFSSMQFLLEFSILLLFIIIFSLGGRDNMYAAIMTFILIAPVVILKNATVVLNIKKTYQEDVELLSEFLNKEEIPDFIELKHDRIIKLNN